MAPRIGNNGRVNWYSIGRGVAVVGALALVASACGDTGQTLDTRASFVATGTVPTPATTTTQSAATATTTSVPVPAESWRLLADETKGRPYTVSIATSQTATDRMWEYFDFETQVPTLDFAREVVVMFTQTVGGGCPDILLGDVVVQSDRVFGRDSRQAGCGEWRLWCDCAGSAAAAPHRRRAFGSFSWGRPGWA